MLLPDQPLRAQILELHMFGMLWPISCSIGMMSMLAHVNKR